MKKAIITVAIIFLASLAYADDLTGSYSATYDTSKDNGLLLFTINENYTINIYSWSKVNHQANRGTGIVGLQGDFIIDLVGGYRATGNISDGEIEGTWTYNNNPKGEIAGEKMDDDVLKEFAGTYTGKFLGKNKGTWTITVFEDGRCLALTHCISDDKTYSAEGIVGINEFIVLTNVKTGVYGKINLSSVLFGKLTFDIDNDKDTIDLSHFKNIDKIVIDA